MGNFLSDLLGGGDSQVSEVNYPDWYTDSKFTSAQDFLDTYSRDLLTTGPNEYYRPIGEYNTPEFRNYLSAVNSSVVGATDAALARSGRARGGQGAQVAAQSVGDMNAKLAFEDYKRAMNGREMFFNTGINVQDSVRRAGFENQSARNAFNVGGAEFDMKKAIYGDAYDRQQSQDIGQMVGTVVGGVGGFMVGGPAGAMAGAGIGGDLFGGSSGNTGMQWLDMINASKKPASGTAGGVSAGVSNIGAIKSPGKLLNQDYSKMIDFAALGL